MKHQCCFDNGATMIGRTKKSVCAARCAAMGWASTLRQLRPKGQGKEGNIFPLSASFWNRDELTFTINGARMVNATRCRPDYSSENLPLNCASDVRRCCRINRTMPRTADKDGKITTIKITRFTPISSTL